MPESRSTPQGELSLLRTWFRYNDEQRPAYLRAIARLPLAVSRGDDGASYPLLDIFVHVLDAYRWWLRYVYRDDVRAFPAERLRGTVRTVPEARAALRPTSQEVRAFLRRLRPTDLDRVVRFRAPSNAGGRRWRTEEVTLRAMLWHLVEEELQHRGEMNALLWRHGVEPPIVPFTEWSGGWRVCRPPRSRGAAATLSGRKASVPLRPEGRPAPQGRRARPGPRKR